MTDEAAIKATFSEWRMVKGRKVLQLIFETPLERQGEVLTMLGAPMPDKEIWCAIAKLASLPPAERPGVEPSSPTARARASEMGKERYAASGPMEQARTRAALLANDERFQAWLPTIDGSSDGEPYTAAMAAGYIQQTCCDGGSRALIAEDPEAYRKFLALLTMFQIAVGEIAEPR